MDSLWVSADVQPDSTEQQVLEVQHTMVGELRELMKTAGIDPDNAPYGTVTMRRFDMRRILDSPSAYAACNTDPDMVRFVVDYSAQREA